MATIRKRTWFSSGQQKTAWQVDYLDQQGKRRARQFPTKRQATDFLATASYEVRQGTHTPASASITVAEAVAMWLEHSEAEGLERNTLRTYGGVARAHVVPIIGRFKLAQLSRPVIEQYRDDLLNGAVPDGQKRSRVMARKALSALKAAIKEAQRRGKVAQNVAAEVSVKAAGRHKRRIEVGVDVPDKAEIKALIDAAAPRWRPLILTAAFGGLRASELRGLRWQDVDFDQRLIRIRQRADRWGKLGSPKSEAGWRDVPVAPLVLNALREWRLACPRGELTLVFPAETGAVMDHSILYRRCFGDVQRACGIVDQEDKPKYGPHAFRHFCASWLIERGFTPKRVMGIMGHASITMTFDLYGHLFPADESDHERLAAGMIGIVG